MHQEKVRRLVTLTTLKINIHQLSANIFALRPALSIALLFPFALQASHAADLEAQVSAFHISPHAIVLRRVHDLGLRVHDNSIM